jgi:acetyl esterase/lipase
LLGHFAHAVLYVHGGGLIAGAPRTHAELASRLVGHVNRRVLLVDYRLAPEHPFPAALDDVRAVYEHLILAAGVSTALKRVTQRYSVRR